MELNPERLIAPKPLPFFKFPRMDCLYKTLQDVIQSSGNVTVKTNYPATAVYTRPPKINPSNSRNHLTGAAAKAAAARAGGGVGGGVVVVGAEGQQEHHFDAVIMACHASAALKLVVNPSWAERVLLGGVEYHPIPTIIHQDRKYMERCGGRRGRGGEGALN
jgi:hypothetical protein